MVQKNSAVSNRSGSSHWDKIAGSPAYQTLIRRKINLIVPASIFFLLYYFALPVLVGFYPEVMSRPVWGKVNGAYLFALSQFFIAWILAALYVVFANGFDKEAADILKKQAGNGVGDILVFPSAGMES